MVSVTEACVVRTNTRVVALMGQNQSHTMEVTPVVEVDEKVEEGEGAPSSNRRTLGESSLTKTQSVNLEWENLNYKMAAGEKKEEKTVLSNLSGSAPAGSMLAIMGPTGIQL